MNIDIKELKEKLLVVLIKIKNSLSFVTVMLILISYGFLIYRIGSLVSIEPTQEQINEKLINVRRPSIDKEAISKIKSLESENIEIQALFKQARDNPFQD